MGKYRLLFIGISALFWGLVIWGVSTVRPELLTELFEPENVIKADKDKPKPPPPPPPPPSCTEQDRGPRQTRAFNIERAYPTRALERGTEGEVSATLRIDASGAVTDVIINSASPPGTFDSAVDREARRMRFEPARRDCQNVAGDHQMRVQFKLTE
jgi:TonB family protein